MQELDPVDPVDPLSLLRRKRQHLASRPGSSSKPLVRTKGLPKGFYPPSAETGQALPRLLALTGGATDAPSPGESSTLRPKALQFDSPVANMTLADADHATLTDVTTRRPHPLQSKARQHASLGTLTPASVNQYQSADVTVPPTAAVAETSPTEPHDGGLTLPPVQLAALRPRPRAGEATVHSMSPVGLPSITSAPELPSLSDYRKQLASRTALVPAADPASSATLRPDRVGSSSHAAALDGSNPAAVAATQLDHPVPIVKSVTTTVSAATTTAAATPAAPPSAVTAEDSAALPSPAAALPNAPPHAVSLPGAHHGTTTCPPVTVPGAAIAAAAAPAQRPSQIRSVRHLQVETYKTGTREECPEDAHGSAARTDPPLSAPCSSDPPKQLTWCHVTSRTDCGPPSTRQPASADSRRDEVVRQSAGRAKWLRLPVSAQQVKPRVKVPTRTDSGLPASRLPMRRAGTAPSSIALDSCEEVAGSSAREEAEAAPCAHPTKGGKSLHRTALVVVDVDERSLDRGIDGASAAKDVTAKPNDVPPPRPPPKPPPGPPPTNVLPPKPPPGPPPNDMPPPKPPPGPPKEAGSASKRAASKGTAREASAPTPTAAPKSVPTPSPAAIATSALPAPPLPQRGGGAGSVKSVDRAAVSSAAAVEGPASRPASGAACPTSIRTTHASRCASKQPTRSEPVPTRSELLQGGPAQPQRQPPPASKPPSRPASKASPSQLPVTARVGPSGLGIVLDDSNVVIELVRGGQAEADGGTRAASRPHPSSHSHALLPFICHRLLASGMHTVPARCLSPHWFSLECLPCAQSFASGINSCRWTVISCEVGLSLVCSRKAARSISLL